MTADTIKTAAGFTTQPSSSLYYGGVRVYAPKAIRAGRPA